MASKQFCQFKQEYDIRWCTNYDHWLNRLADETKFAFSSKKKVDDKKKRSRENSFCPVLSRYVSITKCKMVVSFIEFHTETNSFKFHGEYSKHRLMKCYAMFRNGSFNLSSRVSFRTSWKKTYVTDVCNDISD